MALEICVLGSGSGGNATVVRTRAGVILLDAGLGPRTVERRLAGTGVTLADIAAICLTHLDTDHFNVNWLQTIIRQGIALWCHETCVAGVLDRAAQFDDRSLFDDTARRTRPLVVPPLRKLLHPFTDQPVAPLPELWLQPIHLPHDQTGSHGFVLTTTTGRAGYATDLGHVPETLVEHFCGVDLLAIESNYDPVMEEQSARPDYLKRRIMNGAGHLSNPQALAAVQRILDRTEKLHGPQKLPRHIVLLHRSRQCNCPVLLRQLFQSDARIGPVLTLAEQHQRTGWLG